MHYFQEKLKTKFEAFRVYLNKQDFFKSLVSTSIYKYYINLDIYRRVFVTIYALLGLYFGGVLLFGGYEALSNNDQWIYISILCVLIFPNIISKVILKKGFVSIYSLLGLLIYPLAYNLIFLVSKIGIIDFKDLSLAFFIFVMLASNILIIYYFLKSEVAEIKNTTRHLTPIIIAIAIYSTVLLIIRQPGSIAALDYIQHQAAINNMSDTLCIVPNECSNLFLKVGYTTFYHTISSVFGTYAGNNITKVYYVLDFVWGALGILVSYKFFISFLKRRSLAIFAALIAMLVFVNGAYDFVFFIPQTLAFYIFLSLIGLKKLNIKILITGILMLFVTHFIMGGYFAVLFLLWFVIKENYIYKYVSKLNINKYLAYSIFVILGALILSALGFSIEQTFQFKDIQEIGSLTNLGYPANLGFLYQLLGFGSLILLVSLYYFLKDKNRLNTGIFAIVYLVITISVYLLGPTYANKFLIGYGIFTAIILINYAIDTRMRLSMYGFLGGLLLFVYILNYSSNYHQYLEFYNQRDATVSVITQQDKTLINYLKGFKNQHCIVLSDPYSQIIVAGFSQNQTAAAQYMSPKSRQILYSFISNPQDSNWENLLAIDELKSSDKSDICFLYSSRLEETLKADNTNWITNTYSLIVDNDYAIKELPSAVEYLQNKGYLAVYKTENYILLVP